jgi:NADPH2:quinone reductase
VRTWQVQELGEPADVMRLVDVAPPRPGPGEVLLDVDAVGLSFPDLLMVRGGYQVRPDLPFTPGSEAAGRVAGLGPGTDGVAVGDRVVWMHHGNLAELVLRPPDELLPVPDAMSATQAAALLVNYCTTHFALHERAGLQAGETLLVHAGAGGIGSSAIQLGRAAGALVFATAGGPEKVEVLRRLGVDLAVDYLAEDFVEAVEAATDGRGVDVVLDPVGGDVWDRSRKLVAWGGRMLVVGFASGRIPEHPTNHALLKNYSVVGAHWGASLVRDPSSLQRQWAGLCDLFAEGAVDPLVFAEMTFEEAETGLTLLSSRATTGKVVVVP